MREVGAVEAKTHLPSLLAAVAGGESVVITERGRPVARLVPPDATGERARKFRTPEDAFDALRKLRARIGAKLTVEEILEFRDHGRR